MTQRMARRIADIEPFHVMDLLARARALEVQGRHIVHMEIGEPDFMAPPGVLEAAQAALREGRTHYTPALGLPVLREAIAAWYGHHYGLDLDPGRVVVTPGSSGALQLATLALVDPGDEVLMADPGYPCNRHFVRLAEGRPRTIPVGPETGFQLAAQVLREHWSERTVAVLAASPSNPTGTLIAEAELVRLVETVTDLGGRLLMDEIYHGLSYGAATPTALGMGAEVFVFNSFSKFFGMTGFRVGWLVAPKGYVRALEKLAQNLFLAAPTVGQYAALAAFDPRTLAVLEERRLEFQARRDFLLPALESLGFRIPVRPEGAFYLYADASALCDDSHTFCLDLLERAGVALTPGVDFGAHRARHYVRFAYTTSREELEIGIERLGQAL